MDFEFYGFFQDRLNVLVFGFFEDDTRALVSTIWKNYPVIWILFLLTATAFGLWFFLKRLQIEMLPMKYSIQKRLLMLGWIFIVFFFNGLGARGSLGLFPLTEIDTGFSKSSFVNKLSYGSAHALSRAIKLKKQIRNDWNANLKYFGYQENPKQAFADFFQVPLQDVPTDPVDLMRKKTQKNLWAEKNKPHVLVFVMESFGGYYLQYDQSPFDLMGPLKKHFQEDTYSKYFLSSAQMTIGSIGALMIGSHHRMLSDFLTESEFLNTKFRTSPALTYKAQGYQTKFIYGGNPGWRDINKFAEMQGFDEILGEQEIVRSLPNKNMDRHDWGVHDEDVFHYVKLQLEQATEPQFILVLTTTNHPPFDLPRSYQKTDLVIPEKLKSRLNTDEKTAIARFHTYAYSNQKLAEFIASLKEDSTLGEKTILGVTGDHTFWLVDFDDQDMLNKTSVPFYLYVPNEVRKKLPEKSMGAHSDIFPTLYELSLSEAEYFSLSQDLFQPKPWKHLAKGTVALNFSRFIAHPDYAVYIQSKDQWKLYQWAGADKKLIPIEQPTEKEMQLGAELHLYYKSLMSVTDYFFHQEKLNTMKSQKKTSSK
jgi:phosphoglycerol transferase MdoB-like AlkP superfamily enzyme